MKAVRMLIAAAAVYFVFGAPLFTEEEPARGELKGFLDTRMAQARTLLRDEQYSGAIEIANAILALKPAADYMAEARSLRDKALDAQAQSEALRCEIIPEKRVYFTGEGARITIRLHNASLHEIQIPLPEKEGAKPDASGKIPKEANRFVLNAIVDDYAAIGSSRINSTRSWEEEIADDITLAPGDFWETSVEAGGLTDDVGGLIVRKVGFGVTFAPVLVKEGPNSRQIAPYRWESDAFMVLPKEAAPLAGNPEGALKRALKDGNEAAIFDSAMLLSREKRNLAMRLLAGGLRGARVNSAAESAIIVSMQHALGAYRRRTREEWLAWWDKAWSYYCADDEANRDAVKIALIKRGDSYLITMGGEQTTLAELAGRLREAAALGAMKAEIRCGRDIAFGQFMELHQAVRAAGVRDIEAVYAEITAP